MDYSRYKDILIKNEGGIATVTFNRPQHGNSFSGDLYYALQHIWGDIAEDPEINVVIVTGAGKNFCTGGDVAAMAARFGTEAGWARSLTTPASSGRIVAGILGVPQPVIAAVNGDAIGVGATLALAADISIIGNTGHIGDTHVQVGLVAGDGGAVLWPMLIGANRAKEFLMRGRVVTGAEAFKLDIVNHAVPATRVMSTAKKIAAELNGLPPLAVRWTKATANKDMRMQLERVMELGMAYEVVTMHSQDHLEACKAFLGNHKPKYKGY